MARRSPSTEGSRRRCNPPVLASAEHKMCALATPKHWEQRSAAPRGRGRRGARCGFPVAEVHEEQPLVGAALADGHGVAVEVDAAETVAMAVHEPIERALPPHGAALRAREDVRERDHVAVL